MFGKQGKTEINWPLAILVVIVVLIAFPAIPEKLSGLFGLTEPATPTQTTSPTPVAGCYVDSTTLTLTAEEMFNPATTPGGDAEVWINGEDQGKIANAGSITVSPGDKYKVLWVSNSTSHYGKVTEGVVPCSGTLKLKETLAKWDTTGAAHPTPIVTLDDGSLGKNYNFSLSLGEVATVSVRYAAAYEEAIGNPNVELPNIVACRYNATVIKSIDSSLSAADLPHVASGAADMKWVSFKAGGMLSNDKKLDFDLTVQADSTNTMPSIGDNVGTAINCYVYDGDYDIDGDTGEIIFGVEDEAYNNLGFTPDANFTIIATS